MKKIDNQVWAIYDPQTNTYMQSFVVVNEMIAKRNIDIAKANLKAQCKDEAWIDELKLVKMDLNNYDELIK